MRLVLLRHAKSDWPAGVDDLNRPLSDRGQRDCIAVSSFLTAQTWNVDLAIVSIAERTQQTRALINDGLDYSVEHLIEPAIYEASPGELLKVISKQTAETVILVGHSPGIPKLSLILSDGNNVDAETRIRKKFPTAGVVVLTSELPWAQWQPSMAQLESFDIPRADMLDEDAV